MIPIEIVDNNDDIDTKQAENDEKEYKTKDIRKTIVITFFYSMIENNLEECADKSIAFIVYKNKENI